MNINKKNLVFASLLLVAGIIRVWMVRDLTIYPLPAADSDDALMTRWAMTMAANLWKGSFDFLVFSKEAGFALFLSVLYRLGLPYIETVTVLYVIGCVLMIQALSNIIRNRLCLFVIYLVLVFEPIMTSAEVLQRVYRNGLGVFLVLAIFASMLNLYFSVPALSNKRMIAWSLVSSVLLGFLWVTKSDAIWLLPFVTVVLLITFFYGFSFGKKNGSSKSWFVCCAVSCVLPFLGILGMHTAFSAADYLIYGGTHIEYYDEVLADLTSIENGGDGDKISLTTDTFKTLCDLSPTLNETRDEVLHLIAVYSEYDSNPTDGQVEDGWIGWVLIKGFGYSGKFENLSTANEFFTKVHAELETAFSEGVIAKREKSFLQSYYLDTSSHRKELVEGIRSAWKFVASHSGLNSIVYVADEDMAGGCYFFEKLTREQILFERVDFNYYTSGWLLVEGYVPEDIRLVVENSAGEELVSFTWLPSADVDEIYGFKYPGADMCRFEGSWNASDDGDKRIYMVAYQGDETVAKARIGSRGRLKASKGKILGKLDVYYSQEELLPDTDENRKPRERVTYRVNSISDWYEKCVGGIVAAGGWCWLALSVYLLIGLKKRRYEFVNHWLVITGVNLSLLVLIAGVVVTDLTKCPAVTYMYLSAAYPMMLLAAMLSIVSVLDAVCRKLRKK